MPMIGSTAPDSTAGLSAHARELWRASLRYRRRADALASDGMVKSRQMPVAASEATALVASTADLG